MATCSAEVATSRAPVTALARGASAAMVRVARAAFDAPAQPRRVHHTECEPYGGTVSTLAHRTGADTHVIIAPCEVHGLAIFPTPTAAEARLPQLCRAARATRRRALCHPAAPTWRPPRGNKERAMNRDRIAGCWKQWSGSALQQWGRLLHDAQRCAAGESQYRVGLTQQRCGAARDQAERSMRELRLLARGIRR
jgi:uncharacterized protein YjbJ (UPF0337 family)